MELISGSGVLLGGEIANGVITILGLSCRGRSYCVVYFSPIIYLVNGARRGMVE